jgi:glycosyltransferase involved in cell wall biosynthesis
MNSGRLDVALDVPRTRHISAGMQAYASELAARLPRMAPDLTFAEFSHGTSFGFEEQIALPLRLRRAHPRLVHFLSMYAPYFAPRPFALTIHDLIHLNFPAFHKRRVVPYYTLVVRSLCARAARVITDDERTVEDLERYLGVPPPKVRVVPLGVDDVFLSDAEPELAPRPYFIYAGNHRPHKDLGTLLAAWAALDPAVEVDLYLTGSDDLPGVRPERARGRLLFLGDVDSQRLARFFRGSVALVHPALREGFGLPLLEALCAGTHVIACGDAVPRPLVPYVDLFPARDALSLSALMRRALAAPRASEAARRFARTLTWDRCAAKTAEVYREVLEQSPGR